MTLHSLLVDSVSFYIYWEVEHAIDKGQLRVAGKRRHDLADVSQHLNGLFSLIIKQIALRHYNP